MAAATVAATPVGRTPAYTSDSVIQLTITASATTYATASGGLPFDLAGVLGTNGVGPYSENGLNPNDIFAISGMSANGFIVANFTLGTPTYTAVPGASTASPGQQGTLATCPCTCRMWGTGAANAAHLAEIADGAVTDTLVVLLHVARGGHN